MAPTTPAKALAVDPFCDVLVNRRLHLEHEVGLERVAELWEVRCSGF
jgi:hypothetical protein